MRTAKQIQEDKERILREAKRIGYPIKGMFESIAGFDPMTAEGLLNQYKKFNNIK